MYYFDSSAIVKLYLPEAGSNRLRKLRSSFPGFSIAISEISGAEVFAAFHKRFRTADISLDDLQHAMELFRKDFERVFLRLPATKTVVDTGMSLIQKHPLRGYDAIQLAAAVSFLNVLQGLNGEFFHFVCADKALNNAAETEGLMVINPNDD